jgi:hypothetical protein
MNLPLSSAHAAAKSKKQIPYREGNVRPQKDSQPE